MGDLRIGGGRALGATMVSNYFIDTLLKDANDAQVKVYLYLLRAAGSGMPVSISGIADFFNYTEKDVLRALTYWDKKGVVALELSEKGALLGLDLKEFSCTEKKEWKEEIIDNPSERGAKAEESFPDADSFSVSLDELQDFKNREETEQLIFVTEQYLGRTLSPKDMQAIYFLSDVLRFDSDMVDYLVQYCVDKGKKDFRYITTVGMNWAKEGIRTPKQAAERGGKYEKEIYQVMRMLGKSAEPTRPEVDYIRKWIRTWGFTMELIENACQRAVMTTDKNRISYVDKILESWHKDSVYTMSAVSEADAVYEKKKAARQKGQTKDAKPAFSPFATHDYDYAAYVQKIKVN